MLFHIIFSLLSAVFVRGVSVPSFEDCAVEFLTHRNILNTTLPGEDNNQRIINDCDAKIENEISKFYDETERLIRAGVKIDHLENSDFVIHESCIIRNLRHFNVTDLFLKSIAYQRLHKVHQSDHNYNQRMSSQQILLQYALQVCDPRSFYKRNEENLFKMNMRTTNEQAICLLNYINENISGEAYKFSDNIDSDSDANCSAIIDKLKRKYYYVLDRQRSFSVFGLNPSEAIKCRASNDKSLIDNILLLTIYSRLDLTPDEIQAEKVKFYEIARYSATSFFQCLSKYD